MNISLKNSLFRFVSIATIVFLLSFLSSCNKNEKSYFTGKIYNLSTKETVKEAKVILEASQIKSGNMNSSFSKIAETISDSDGNYFIEIEPKLYLKFKIRVEKEAYHKYFTEIEPQDQAAEYKQDYPLAEASFIKIKIKNNPPAYSDDLLKIQIEGINEACVSCSQNDFTILEGANIDTDFLIKTVGGETIRISFIKTINGNTNFSTKEYFCPPGDTVKEVYYY